MDRGNRDRQVLVVWRRQAICYASVYKVPKMAHRAPDIKGKPRQSRGSVAKATRKEVVSRATSKHICGRATARVSEKHRGWQQRRHSRKNGVVGAKEGSKW